MNFADWPMVTCELAGCCRLLVMPALMLAGSLAGCLQVDRWPRVLRLLAFRGWTRWDINADDREPFAENTIIVGLSELTITTCNLLSM